MRPNNDPTSTCNLTIFCPLARPRNGYKFHLFKGIKILRSKINPKLQQKSSENIILFQSA